MAIVVPGPKITLITKITASGVPCDKCLNAKAYLEREGAMCLIDEELCYDQRDTESEESQRALALATAHGRTNAPLIIVDDPEEEGTRCFIAVSQFLKWMEAYLEGE